MCKNKGRKQVEAAGDGALLWCTEIFNLSCTLKKIPETKSQGETWSNGSEKFDQSRSQDSPHPSGMLSYWSLFQKLYFSYYFVGCCWINGKEFIATILIAEILVTSYTLLLSNFSFCLLSSVRIYGIMLLGFGWEHFKSSLLNIYSKINTKTKNLKNASEVDNSIMQINYLVKYETYIKRTK